jgi:hypothetical protein
MRNFGVEGTNTQQAGSGAVNLKHGSLQALCGTAHQNPDVWGKVGCADSLGPESVDGEWPPYPAPASTSSNLAVQGC